MKEQIFQLAEKHEFIQLNNLLQIFQLAQTGGHAKILIQNKEVKVNGEVETRVRKKLRKGDQIQIDKLQIKII